MQRGPAPVMYGATSFVGVIQVVRRRSRREGRPRGGSSGGSYGSGGGALTFGFPTWLRASHSSLSGDFERQGFKDDRTSFKKSHLLWRNRRTCADGSFRFDVDATWLRQEPASPSPRRAGP